MQTPVWNTGSFLTVPRLLSELFQVAIPHQGFISTTQQTLEWLFMHVLLLCFILFLSLAKHHSSFHTYLNGFLFWEAFFSKELFPHFQDPWCHALIIESLATWVCVLFITFFDLSSLSLALNYTMGSLRAGHMLPQLSPWSISTGPITR